MSSDKRSQSGFSLVEVLVVLAIAMVIIMASFQMLEETTRVTMFIETRNDLPIIAQGAVNNIQTAVSQSRQIFDRDATGIGPGYFSAIVLTGKPALLTDSKLPLVNSSGQFIQDKTGEEYTGNCLLIARQLSPLTVTYTGGTLLADRYRFEFFYLTKGTGWKFTKWDGYLDTMRGRTVEYADYFQLSNLVLTTAQRKEINDKLIAGVLGADNVTHVVKLAWDPGQPIGSAVYDIKSDGSSVAAAYTAVANAKLTMTDVKSLTPTINSGRIFGKANYSIAFRPDATTTYPITTPVPKYALFNTGKPLFPSGLEFMVVGSANTRRVLTRMAVMAHYRAREYASQEASVITAP